MRCQKDVSELYMDWMKWTEKCLYNIASSGKFSSDRTIKYVCLGVCLFVPVCDVWVFVTCKMCVNQGRIYKFLGRELKGKGSGKSRTFSKLTWPRCAAPQLHVILRNFSIEFT